MINDLTTPFDRRVSNIKQSKFCAPLVDVMDTFDAVCLGLESYAKGKWSAADAVRLTELVLSRVPE